MARMHSPLRYPGGKTCMLPLMSAIIQQNDLSQSPYAEPFAGGCGLALALLFQGVVSEIHINDIDQAIWSFWHCAINRTGELVEKIQTAELSVDEWRRQRDFFMNGDRADELSLGFSAFYLNRTNRSGIIKGAGVIGGLEQKGNYKLDCRFNKDDLTKRVLRIGRYKSRIHLTRLDALDFLEEADGRLPKRSMICIDPPYFHKGSSLYTSFYRGGDHAELADVIQRMDRPWVVTYDNTPEINALYSEQSQYLFDVNYSVQTKRLASELMVASPNLSVPFDLRDRLAG